MSAGWRILHAQIGISINHILRSHRLGVNACQSDFACKLRSRRSQHSFKGSQPLLIILKTNYPPLPPHTHAHTHTNMHGCTHTHKYAWMHTHTHIHTHNPKCAIKIGRLLQSSEMSGACAALRRRRTSGLRTSTMLCRWQHSSPTSTSHNTLVLNPAPVSTLSIMSVP